MATGGYEFEGCEKIGEDFQCSICFNILRETMALPECPHSFCRICLSTWQEERGEPFTCPTCRDPYTKNQVFLNRKVDQFIRTSLTVFCKKHKNGCSWKGTIDNYDLHAEQKCLFADIGCPNVGCTVVYIRKNQDHHLSNCVMRLVPCPHCEEMIAYLELKEHYQNCPRMTILCLNVGCNQNIQRQYLKRNEMDEHSQNSHEHFALIFKEYCEMKRESISIRVELNKTIEKLNVTQQTLHENIIALKETKHELNVTQNTTHENIIALNETKQKLNVTQQKLHDTIIALDETKHELNVMQQTLNENTKLLNDTKQRLGTNDIVKMKKEELKDTKQNLNENMNEQNNAKQILTRNAVALPPHERNVEKCIEQLKWFNENVDNYESLFKKLLDVMKSDTRCIINGSSYYKVNIHERWHKRWLYVDFVDGRRFDKLKTHDNTVHHNNNVCVHVRDDYVVIHLLVEEGWTNDNKRHYILNPKLHEKVDGSRVHHCKYRDCLVDGFILLQVCRK